MKKLMRQSTEATGTTFAAYASGPRGRPPPHAVPGCSYVKPLYSSITGYNMNTGEIAFRIPAGETPDRIRNNPALEGVDIGDTGSGRAPSMVTTPSMLVYAGVDHDGQNRPAVRH